VSSARALVELESVVLLRDGERVLGELDWIARADERWVVLGPNGSGKTSLVSLAGAQTFPSLGRATVLGEELGKTDMRALRRRIGWVSGALLRSLRPRFTAHEIVMMGRHGALEPWWHDYDDADRARAHALLAAAGHAGIAERPLAVLSEGERQQVMLARALMQSPDFLILDEPFAGLDLGARERLVSRLDALANDPTAPPFVLVTHHVEEIPRAASHAILLEKGRVIAQGAIDDVLASEAPSRAFGLPLDVRREGSRGRWRASARA
jgi:iron complex transport system ATP-binding protein